MLLVYGYKILKLLVDASFIIKITFTNINTPFYDQSFRRKVIRMSGFHSKSLD